MKAQFLSDTVLTNYVLPRAAAQDEMEATKELPQCFIPRLKSGDPDAFADLYQMYRRRVFGVILKIVDSPATAEDLAQESFLKLWRNAANLKLEYQLVGPWLMRVARNCALDYRKSASTLRIEQILTDHAAPTVLEEQSMVWKRRQLRQAFLQLRPEQKEVILLSFYEGLSQVAIAERLQLPLGTIKGRVRLGLAKLRVAMEGTCSQERSSARYQ